MRKFTNNNLPYPNCIYAGQDELGDAIVLEDLSLTNYKMMNRLKGLNFEQCSSVMEVSIFLFKFSNLYFRIEYSSIYWNYLSISKTQTFFLLI